MASRCASTPSRAMFFLPANGRDKPEVLEVAEDKPPDDIDYGGGFGRP